MRERMLSAADDLSTAIVEMIMALAPISSEREYAAFSLSPAEVTAVITRSREHTGLAIARMGRVELLFGDGRATATAYEAIEAVSTLVEKLDAVTHEEGTGLTPALWQEAQEVSVAARSSLTTFNEAARNAATAWWWQRPALASQDRRARKARASRARA